MEKNAAKRWLKISALRTFFSTFSKVVIKHNALNCITLHGERYIWVTVLLIPTALLTVFSRAIIFALNSSTTVIKWGWKAYATLGSVSSRECLDAPAIFATFTAGRTGLVIVKTDQSETSPLKFAGQNVRHNLARFRPSLEISHF